jgi:hypothetical protein
MQTQLQRHGACDLGAEVSQEDMTASRHTALLLLCALHSLQAAAQIPLKRFDEGAREGPELTSLGQGLQLLSAFLRPAAEDGGRLGETFLRLPGARRRERRSARRDAAGQALEGMLASALLFQPHLESYHTMHKFMTHTCV